MTNEIKGAFQKVIEKNILNITYAPLSSYISDNCSRLDLAYSSSVIENVDQATLVDVDLVKVDDIDQNGDILTFKAVVDAEVEIEETVHRDREVEGVQKWFTLTCYAKIDDIPDSFSIKSINPY